MEKQFDKYLHNTASPEEFTSVLNALCAEDSEGKVSLELLKLWKETLSATIDHKENSSLLDRIHHRIAIEESNAVNRRVILYRNLLKVAALIIMGFLISAIVFYRPHTQMVASVVETVTTPYGARTSFKLPDGSEVWLNSGSEISFPRQYSDIRKVELKGEAYFEVVKDGKPFVVETSSGKVEVMGTSFDVRAYPNEDFETTLVEGSVKVSDRNDVVKTLKPGQRSLITNNNEFLTDEVNPDLITSWKEGKLIFDKEPLIHVATELERWYNVKIELKGENLKRLCYTGTIEMETFSEILELINATTPIKYQYDKNSRVLRITGR